MIASKKGDHIGPVVSKVQYDKIINLIKSGIEEGATLAAGGPDLPKNLNNNYDLNEIKEMMMVNKIYFENTTS